MKKLVFFLCIVCMTTTVEAQEFIPLWEKGKMPNSRGLNLPDSIANERIYRVGTPGLYLFDLPSRKQRRRRHHRSGWRICSAGLPNQRIPTGQVVQYDGNHGLCLATSPPAIARCQDMLQGSSTRYTTCRALHTRPCRPLGHRASKDRRYGFIGRGSSIGLRRHSL